jgi:hypothetical protein
VRRGRGPSLGKLLSLRNAELVAAGKMKPGCQAMPGRAPQRRPNTKLHYVPARVDGIALDNVEAAVTFADQPWARRARYLGMWRGRHVWEVPE